MLDRDHSAKNTGGVPTLEQACARRSGSLRRSCRL